MTYGILIYIYLLHATGSQSEIEKKVFDKNNLKNYSKECFEFLIELCT